MRIILVVALFAAAASAEKVHNWQTGTVRDSNRDSSFAGMSTTTTGQSGTGYSLPNYGGATSTSTARYAVYQTYVIEADKYVYVADEYLRWRWSKAANLTVNAPVKFAVEKKALYLLDEDGKEHKASITKRILKK